MIESRLRNVGVGLVSMSLLVSPLGATCGGGGGGGVGGVSAGTGSPEPTTYQAPWVVVRPGVEIATPGLVLYWFPTSPEEARASALQTSRSLTLWSARCVFLAIVPGDYQELRARYTAPATSPSAVLALGADGSEVARLGGGEKLPPGDVEKLVGSELKRREKANDSRLAAAKAKEKSDAAAATALYQEVWSERCLDPGAGKKAAKALKKLGHPVADQEAARLGDKLPVLVGRVAEQVEAALRAGLDAELADRYEEARDYYQRAHRLDPADPVALRYLAELERHHTGEWAAARRNFEALLRAPADAISRAVAMHGLGKMTIHEGRFAEGLALFEQSIATWALPLTYRNLAVYWNSEGAVDKARGFAELALALDPQDPYNRVFHAAFAIEGGDRALALAALQEYGDLLPASYNLAAIHALLGDRVQALTLLRRHLYEYERYDAVRAREMKEAREDIVFVDLRGDPEFVALTALADRRELLR
jgi:tetratricopeptide (TPR) repeat protein